MVDRFVRGFGEFCFIEVLIFWERVRCKRNGFVYGKDIVVLGIYVIFFGLVFTL